jgi:hypothetical protein
MNRVEYQGKTREEFVALEASIHDFTGTSPLEEGTQRQQTTTSATQNTSSNTYRAAAISLQELAAGSNGHWFDDSSLQPQK